MGNAPALGARRCRAFLNSAQMQGAGLRCAAVYGTAGDGLAIEHAIVAHEDCPPGWDAAPSTEDIAGWLAAIPKGYFREAGEGRLTPLLDPERAPALLAAQAGFVRELRAASDASTPAARAAFLAVYACKETFGEHVLGTAIDRSEDDTIDVSATALAEAIADRTACPAAARLTDRDLEVLRRNVAEKAAAEDRPADR